MLRQELDAEWETTTRSCLGREREVQDELGEGEPPGEGDRRRREELEKVPLWGAHRLGHHGGRGRGRGPPRW
jgi:hypothetical protein